jgi:hypothetical protein
VLTQLLREFEKLHSIPETLPEGLTTMAGTTLEPSDSETKSLTPATTITEATPGILTLEPAAQVGVHLIDHHYDADLDRILTLANAQGLRNQFLLQIAAESDFNTNEVSSAGAIGLLQVMPAVAVETARNVKSSLPDFLTAEEKAAIRELAALPLKENDDDAYSDQEVSRISKLLRGLPRVNLFLGVHDYLGRLHARHGQNELALLDYVWGQGHVDTFLAKHYPGDVSPLLALLKDRSESHRNIPGLPTGTPDYVRYILWGFDRKERAA